MSSMHLGGAEIAVDPLDAIVDLVVDTPVIPVFETEQPPSPDIEILPVPGAPGADGADYDDMPDLTLIFENGLI